MNTKTLHMIGNAHIDPVWLWPWQEGYSEIKATFRSALDRMKEYEDFFFTASSSAFYEWIEENEPAMFEEIKQRIAEGRWAIVGGWWVEPDCTVPSGESFVRHGLYGQRYFKEKFGKIATTGFNIDSFGHSGSLPQILKKSGIENYTFLRPGRHEKGIETDTFYWRSSDGSEICAFRIPFQYNSWPEGIKDHILRCANEIKQPDGSIMCFYGVGNHGGGPTKKNIESILELREGSPKLMFSTPDRYFEEVKKSGRHLPVIYGDLFHHASGCYSANSTVKQLNRKAENRLVTAEKVSVAAKTWSHGKYPLEKYKQSWKNVLFNQFHDILTGTSIQTAYEDAVEAYGEALHTAGQGLNAAMQAISWKIDIPHEEGTKPIVVFNPNAFPGKFAVEMETSLTTDNTLWSSKSMILFDDEGTQVPLQFVQAEATCFGRVRLCFVADLPSMGYKTYKLTVTEKAQQFPCVEATDTMAENRWFKLIFDEKTGYIQSLRKKNDDTEYFGGPAAVPVVMEDKSDTWAHGVTIFDKEIGRFCAKTVKKVESGPVKAVIRVTSYYENSKIIQDFSVFSELDFVHVKTTVDWREQHKMLKLAFPMNLNALRATWEIPYGVSLRVPNGEEFPMQKFVDVEGVNPGQQTAVNGLTFINDGKTSGAIAGKDVYMTVLRSPIYAHHDPTVPDENLEYVYQDQGIQRFNYALYPHDGSWETAHTVRRSYELNEKPIAIFETYHEGHLPRKNSFIEIGAENVMLVAMKEAEDASGDVILRFVETAGRPCEVKIDIYGLKRTCTLAFSAFEIKTLRVPRQENIGIIETDLLEFPLDLVEC